MKKQAEVQEMLDREAEVAERSHQETVRQHREIMEMIDNAKAPGAGKQSGT